MHMTCIIILVIMAWAVSKFMGSLAYNFILILHDSMKTDRIDMIEEKRDMWWLLTAYIFNT